jgi:DNA-directed RNA polymerase subunit L
MDQNTANTIINLLKELLSKPDGVVVAAYITVGGMFGVAVVTALVQWFVTRTILRSEHQRLHIQLQTDFRLKQFSQWQQEFISTISELLTHTDPEVYPTPERTKVVPLIQKAQLMLNLELEAHRKVNGLINELGLAVNKWETRDLREVLSIHSRLLEAARAALYLPGH